MPKRWATLELWPSAAVASCGCVLAAEPDLPAVGTVQVVSGGRELAETVAELVISTLARGISRRGRARWVLAGGSTPLAAYRLLATRPRALDWSRVEFFWGDERCVPPTATESNYRAASEVLLDPLKIEQGRRFHVRGEAPREEAVRAYDTVVGAALGAAPWDLVLLGLGSDGHTASLFPPRLPAEEGSEWVVATMAPSPPMQRVSMTLKALEHARKVVFLAAGAGKATAVARVLSGDRTLHASCLSPGANWCIDRAAASKARATAPQSAIHWR